MANSYPGRRFVTGSSVAARLRFEQLLPDALDKPHRCECPIDVHGIGLPDPMVGGRVIPVTVPARCRKCPSCLEHRRRLWTARAVAEIRASRRTWFGTLTVRPTERFQYALRSGLTESVGNPRDGSAVWYSSMSRHVGRDVTLMLKRIRAAGARFRYLLVFEAHKDGWPHCHMLLHETHDPIRKRVLDEAWPLGFCKWRLVSDPGAATYVAKYLAKDALARVRASVHYGDQSLVTSLAERLQSATSAATLCDDDDESPSERRQQRKTMLP